MPASHEKRSTVPMRRKAIFKRVFAYFCIGLAVALALGALLLRDCTRASYELALNYEQADSGTTPTDTRFTVSQLKSTDVLQRALSSAGLPQTEDNIQALASRITIAYDDTDPENTARPATRYTVTYQKNLFTQENELDDIAPNQMLVWVLDAYKAAFAEQYVFTPAVPQFDWSECSELEYKEIGPYLQNASARLAGFLRTQQQKYATCLSEQSAETVDALLRRLEDFETVDLEKYTSFIQQSGLARNSTRLTYTLQNQELIYALSGTELTADSKAQNSALLTKLQTNTAAAQDTATAEAMITAMQVTLSELCAQAAAIHNEAAAARAQEVLSIIYIPAFTHSWTALGTTLAGCAVFGMLCLANFALYVLRCMGKRGQHEKH